MKFASYLRETVGLSFCVYSCNEFLFFLMVQFLYHSPEGDRIWISD